MLDEADRMLVLSFESQISFICKDTDINLQDIQIIMTLTTISEQITQIIQS